MHAHSSLGPQVPVNNIAMRTVLSGVLFCVAYVFQGMAVDVTTYHNDKKRTGVNNQETTLTPAVVGPATFGKVGFWPTDGQIVAMPLFLSGVTIRGAQHDVVYVVTEHDSVYAFDAASGAILWQASAIYPGEHVSSYRNCGAISPEIGITGTPVIDRSKNAIYFVAATQDVSKNYHQRLYALSLTTGAQLLSPTEIHATYYGTPGGHIAFDPAQHLQRPALLESNGYIYVGFGSHCDEVPYYGWLMEYKAATLQQTSILNLAPNPNSARIAGTSLWMSGGGPAADSQGFIYVETGNGPFDVQMDNRGFPSHSDYGNAVVKIKPGMFSPMLIVDYFAMMNTVDESDADLDLGSGGPLVVDVAGTAPLLIVVGKDTNMYVLNRNNMGKWDPNQDHVYQEMDGALRYGMFSQPIFFNNTLYSGPEFGKLVAYPIVGGYFSRSPSSQSTHSFSLRGSSVTISANGTSDGVVWAPECINCLDTASGESNEILHAFNASDLSQELYNTTQSGDRDYIGSE